jgi:predicted RNase H-like nuclease
MSAQAFGIVAKVRDVDAVLTPERQARVIEAHPELSFRRLAGVETMPSKKTAAGVAARINALQMWLPDLLDALAATPHPVPVNDALDALACAWTAQRWKCHDPDLVVVGDDVRDERGLLMRIVI